MTSSEGLFDHSTANDSPETGRLLVAEPFLHDEHFERSVIVPVTIDPADGVMGLVLGHKSDMTLGEIVDCVDEDCSIPVYLGGPMGQDTLFYIHKLGTDFDPDSKPLGNGLWLGSYAQSALMAACLKIFPENSFRFFLGYSGWTPGQLEREIKEDTWAMTTDTLSADTLLTLDGDKLWNYAVRSLGERFRHWLLHPRRSYLN